MNQRHSDAFDYGAAIMLWAVGALLLGIAFNGQLGVLTDSIHYASAGQSLAAGHGFASSAPDGIARPLTVWPPLYSAVLAPGVWLGNLSAWSCGLHAVLFGLMAAITYLVVRWTGASRAGATLAGVLALGGGGAIAHTGTLLSEALFLPLQLGGVWALAAWAHNRSSRYLWLAGALVCMATLTRYAGQGPALALVVLVWVFQWRQGDTPRLRALQFLIASQLAVLAWLCRNWLVADTVADRAAGLQSIDFGWFLDVWRVMTLWLWPEQFSRAFRHPKTLVVMAAFGSALAVRLAEKVNSRARAAAAVAGTWIAGYLGLVFATEFGVVRAQDLDTRMPLPVMLLLACLAGVALPSARRPRAVLVWMFAVVAALAAIGRTAALAIELRTEGRGFTSRQWRESGLLEAARTLPAGAVLASNQAEAVYWHLDRPCQPLPTAAEGGKDHTRLDPERVARLRAVTQGRECYLLLFDQTWPWHAPVAVIEQELSLTQVATFPDGTLYRLGD